MGLLDMLAWTREVTTHCRPPTPLLVDENIHYRILKLVYGTCTCSSNFHSYVHLNPPIMECGTDAS